LKEGLGQFIQHRQGVSIKDLEGIGFRHTRRSLNDGNLTKMIILRLGRPGTTQLYQQVIIGIAIQFGGRQKMATTKQENA
jgi:hypothetical protein